MYARGSAPSAALHRKSPCGTHAAWRVPVRDHHENGGADRSPGAGGFRSLAAHHATMAVFLSTGLLSQMEKELAEAGYGVGHSGGDHLQGDMAEGEDRPLHRLYAGEVRKRRTESKKTAMIFIGDVFPARERQTATRSQDSMRRTSPRNSERGRTYEEADSGRHGTWRI